MAWIGKHIYPNTGTEVWRIQFRRETNEGREIFSASFKNKKEASEFCDKWEHIFSLQGKEAMEIDRLHERRRRKHYDKLENIS